MELSEQHFVVGFLIFGGLVLGEGFSMRGSGSVATSSERDRVHP